MLRTSGRLILLALPCAALLVLASGCSTSGARSRQSQVTTTIQMGAATAQLGAEAKADLKALAVGAPGLGAWTIEVAYDPTVVSVTGCTGTETSACNTHKDDHTIRLAGANGVGLQGDATLMTLTFQCKAAGTSPLKVTVEVFADATIGDPLAINAPTQDGSFTCS
jgi:hypothetical protein